MNEVRIHELKNALREVVAMISAREGPIPPDLKAMLVQVMEHVATRIQQLRAEEQEEPVQGLQPRIPELQPGPFPSSNIHAFKYDPQSQQLLVKFQDKYPATNGAIYSYSGIPAYIYDVFRRGAVAPKGSGGNQWHRFKRGVTPSLGASLSALIKAGGYSYQRLT